MWEPIDQSPPPEGLNKGEALEKYSGSIGLGGASVPVARSVSCPAGPDSDEVTGPSARIIGGIPFS